MKKARAKKWPGKNTGPLILFLEGVFPEGILLSTLAERTGLTSKGLSASFRLDDMRLSKAESIVQALGYNLRLEYSYDGTYPSGSTYVPSGNAGNLYGLEEYCQRMGRTPHFVGICASCKGETVRAALRKGDIMLSTLNRISESLRLKIDWNYEKGGSDA